MSDFRRPPSSPTPAGDPDSHTEPSCGNTKRLLSGSYIGMIIVAASTNALPVCLTAIGASFALGTQTQLGVIASVLFAGKLLGTILNGPLADRFGLRAFLLIGAIVDIIALVMMGLAPTYCLLLMAVFLVGVGASVFDVLLNPLICQLRPTATTSGLNLLHAFYPIGNVGTIIAASAILNLTASWRAVFPVMALPAIAYLILVIPCQFPRIDIQGRRIPAWRMLASPLFLSIVLIMMIVASTDLGPTQWLPAYMEQVFAWPRSASAAILIAYSTLMAIGRLGASGLSRRVSAMLLLLVTTVLCTICLVIGSIAGSAWAAAAALALLGLGVAALWPTGLAYAADRFPTGGATMFSILNIAGSVGGILSPAMIGAVGDYASLRWGMGALAALPLVAALVFLWRLIADRPQSSPRADHHS